MKEYLKTSLVLSAIFLIQPVFAQDSLHLIDGKSIAVKVLEIESGVIKYKKFTNLDGPTYTVEKSKILRVKFVNGEEELFQKVEPTPAIPVSAIKADFPTKPQSRNKVFVKIDLDELSGLSSEVKNFMHEWKYFDVVLNPEEADFILQITTLKKGMTFWTNTSVSSKALMLSKSGAVLWESEYYKSTTSISNGYNSLHGSLKKLFNNGLKKKYT